MKYIPLLLLSFLVDHRSNNNHGGVASAGTVPRYNIPFQYRMDVNETIILVEEGVTKIIDSLDDGLDVLRDEALEVLRDRLDGVEGVEVITFLTTEMDKDVECIPIFSKWCTCATSEVVLMVDDDTTKSEVYEYATAEEVRNFVSDFNDKYESKMFVEWYGPIQVTADIILTLSPTTSTMNDYEQLSLQEALKDTITHIGNIEITDTFIFVQELRPETEEEAEERRQRRSLQDDEDDTNYVRVAVRGKCTIPTPPPPGESDDDDTPVALSCSETEFAKMYRDTIEDVSHDILTYLDDSTFSHYFHNINMTTVDSVGGIPDSSKSDTTLSSILTVSNLEDPVTEEDYPYWIIGVLCGVIVILGATVAYGFYAQNKKAKTTAVDTPHNNDGGELS